MERERLNQMHKNLNEFIASGVFKEKKIVIFGSNEPAEKMMEYLEKNGISTYGLVDNNTKKDGIKLHGINITLPEKLLKPKKDNAIILIASRYYSEMVAQLEEMGYEEEKEIRKVVEYNAYSSTSTTVSEFEKRCRIVECGEKIINEVLDKYNNPEKIFVYPFQELGATYMGMSLTRQYNTEHNISNAVFIVADNGGSKLGYIFGYENRVFTVSGEEMEAVIQYAVFTDMAEGKILVVNHRFPYTCRIGEIGNYKGINFTDIYRYGVFELEKGSIPEKPYIHRDDGESRKYTEKLFEDNNLMEKKTVILLPYANTAPRLNNKFWESMAENLTEKGYTVCTNSSGEDEPAIKGTRELFFDLRYGLEVVEKAGTVIGLRSGLCDVLSTAKAGKIILYPDRVYGPDSFINFYSLNRIGLCDDAVEMVVSDDMDLNGVVEKVIEMLRKD